jgi:hypothetical protein
MKPVQMQMVAATASQPAREEDEGGVKAGYSRVR